jgi:hypothetical protein
MTASYDAGLKGKDWIDTISITVGDSMKAYIMTTGAVFGLLVVAHIWRIIEEGPALAKDPWYIVITIAAAALCLWSWRLLRLIPRS